MVPKVAQPHPMAQNWTCAAILNYEHLMGENTWQTIEIDAIGTPTHWQTLSQGGISWNARIKIGLQHGRLYFVLPLSWMSPSTVA